MRAPSEGITWRKIDPWVKALDFLGKDITRGVQISGAPTILLPNKNTAEADAPPVGGKVSYEVTYTIRDLRGLSTLIFRQVDVIATRPTITPLSEAFVSLPLAEVGSFSFFEWINEIEVLDVRGNRLPYDPNKSLGSFHIEGTFNLNEQGVFNNLKLVAIDWRGLQSEYEGVSISVEAKVPEFSGDNEFSAELSSVKLTSLIPPISAVDEFNNSISNVQLIGVSSDTDTREIGTDFRLNQLKQGMTYRLRYQTTDFRDITSEKVIDFSVSVSVPKILNSADFNSSFVSINSAKTIEYGDPGNELEDWLNSHTAEDYLGNKIEINTSVREDQNSRSIDYLKRTNPFNDASNQITYEVSFTAVDSRWQEGVDASWEPFLTVTNRYNLSVKATPPKIDLVFHNPREGLGVSDDPLTISFLVQTKGDMKTEFEDDGNFTLYADDGVQPLEDRTLYYRAYAYEGKGEGKGDFDITEYVSVVNGVDNSQIKTDESNLEISVNDFAYRKSRTDTILEGGAVLTLNPTVKISGCYFSYN